MLLNKTHGWQQ